MKEKLQLIKDFLFSPTHSRTLGVLLVLILIVGTIVTVQVLPQQTNTQQHASTIGSGGSTTSVTCAKVSSGAQCATTENCASVYSGTTECSSQKPSQICCLKLKSCVTSHAQACNTNHQWCDTTNSTCSTSTVYSNCQNIVGKCGYVPPTPTPKQIVAPGGRTTLTCGPTNNGTCYWHSTYSILGGLVCDANAFTNDRNAACSNSTWTLPSCDTLTHTTGATESTVNENNCYDESGGNVARCCIPGKPINSTPAPKTTPKPTPPPAPKTVPTTNGNLSITSNSHLCNNNLGVCISSAGSVDPNNKYVVNNTGGQPYDGTSPYTNPRDFTPTTNLSSTCRINCVSIDTATIKGYQDVCQLITANKWHVVKSAQGDCQTFLDTVPTVCCEPGASTQTTPATTPKSTTTPTQAPGCPAGTNCGGTNTPTTPNVCTDKPAQTNLVLAPTCSNGKISEVKANFPAATSSTGYILDWWFHRTVSGKDEYNECAKAFTANGTAVGSYSNNAGGANRELGTTCFDSNATSFGAAYRIETKACTGPSSNPATYIPMTVCQATTVTLNVKMPGIGTAQFENNSPAHPTRNNVGVVIFDQSGNASTRTTTTLTYNSSTGLFVSSPINVGVLPYTTAKEFRVYLGVPQFLKAFGRKDSSKGTIIALTPGVANTVTIFPQPGDIVDAQTGNLGQDDIIDTSDYNVLRECYNQTGSVSMQSGNTTVSVNCADVMNFLDYPDGGTTGDEFAANYNAWLRSSIAACSANSKCTGD